MSAPANTGGILNRREPNGKPGLPDGLPNGPRVPQAWGDEPPAEPRSLVEDGRRFRESTLLGINPEE